MRHIQLSQEREPDAQICRRLLLAETARHRQRKNIIRLRVSRFIQVVIHGIT